MRFQFQTTIWQFAEDSIWAAWIYQTDAKRKINCGFTILLALLFAGLTVFLRVVWEDDSDRFGYDLAQYELDDMEKTISPGGTNVDGSGGWLPDGGIDGSGLHPASTGRDHRAVSVGESRGSAELVGGLGYTG